jgi:MoaD family protein
MRITVRVYGDIATIIGRNHEMEIPESATVTTLMNRLGEKTGQRQGYLGEFKIGGKDLAIILNGRNVETLGGTGSSLKDGDEIVIMRPTAGG